VHVRERTRNAATTSARRVAISRSLSATERGNFVPDNESSRIRREIAAICGYHVASLERRREIDSRRSPRELITRSFAQLAAAASGCFSTDNNRRRNCHETACSECLISRLTSFAYITENDVATFVGFSDKLACTLRNVHSAFRN